MVFKGPFPGVSSPCDLPEAQANHLLIIESWIVRTLFGSGDSAGTQPDLSMIKINYIQLTLEK
jgi:hypothetical protein